MSNINREDEKLLKEIFKPYLIEPPPNLCPTFYKTLNYEDELKLFENSKKLFIKLLACETK